jgi:hypothetical protein
MRFAPFNALTELCLIGSEFQRPAKEMPCRRALMAIRPYVREITSSTLADGEACTAIGPNAEFQVARKLLHESGRKADFHYVIPKEGSIIWIDVARDPGRCTASGECPPADRLPDAA